MIKRVTFMFLLIILLLITGSEFMYPGRVMVMPELINPTSMATDGTHVFIADGPEVFIYRMSGSRELKRIGREGDGPGEFRIAPNLPITVNLHNGDIYVSSLGKISIWTADGIFKKEIRNKAFALNIIPCGDKFVGKGIAQDEGNLYFTVNIYDDQMNKIREVFREKREFRRGSNNKFDPVDATGPSLAAAGQRLYVNAGDNRNTFFVYGLNGSRLNAITHDFNKIRLTRKHIDKYMAYLESDPDFKDFVARTKHLFKFNDVFPLVQNFFINGEKLFVTSYENENGKRDLYVFDLDGAFLRHMEIPLVSQNVDIPFPFTIFQGKVYQIVENEDEENWELFVHNTGLSG